MPFIDRICLAGVGVEKATALDKADPDQNTSRRQQHAIDLRERSRQIEGVVQRGGNNNRLERPIRPRDLFHNSLAENERMRLDCLQWIDPRNLPDRISAKINRKGLWSAAYIEQ